MLCSLYRRTVSIMLCYGGRRVVSLSRSRESTTDLSMCGSSSSQVRMFSSSASRCPSRTVSDSCIWRMSRISCSRRVIV